MATKRYGMVIDLRKCIGCEACTVACKSENDVPLGHFRTLVQKHEVGTYPKVKHFFVPTLCNHCEAPACVSVCPTAASIKRTEDGIVYVNTDDCIGCQYCVSACPYGARYYDEERKVVDKCTYCMHRVDAGILPSCVNTCVGGARVFGDLNDPNSAVSKAMAQKNVVRVGDTNTGYILPEGMDRSILPADYDAPAPLGAWTDVLKPASKAILGGAAAAVVVGIAANAMKNEKEGESHD